MFSVQGALFIFTILFLDECSVDIDCPFSKECRNQECVDPCDYISCGSQALCKAESHIGICYCPQGLQGNPIVNCVEVGCQQDNDCSTSERCNRGTGNCTPLCTGQPCAQGAYCKASQHREICTCVAPLKGDGHIYCAECKVYISHYICLKKCLIFDSVSSY